jgi:hypothetical protein
MKCWTALRPMIKYETINLEGGEVYFGSVFQAMVAQIHCL